MKRLAENIERLGFEDDERDFRIGSEILRSMGFSSVRLLTNNPAKIEMMEQTGISVAERVPLRVGETAHNRAYLETRRANPGISSNTATPSPCF